MWNKNEQRIRVAAFNFLNNISLDGTHNDTKIGRLRLNINECILSVSENNLSPQGVFPHESNLNQASRSRLRNFSSISENVQGNDLCLFPSVSSYDDNPQIGPSDFQNSSSLTTVTSGTHNRHYSPTKSLCSDNTSPKLSIKKNKNISKRRIMLVSKRKSPVVIFSNIPYNVKSNSSRDQLPKKQSSMLLEGQNLLSTEFTTNENQDVSYAYLLVPSRMAVLRICPQTAPPIGSTHSSPESANTGEEIIYDANLLDNPELKSEKHRTLLTFPSYMTSIIDYAKPDDLKKELNGKFKEIFPHIQLSLSKLRSLKRDMRKIACTKCGLDLWDVAQAYVFFEKIILKGFLTKQLRKLIASACLILSSKLNDIRSTELTKLVEEIEDTFKVNKRDVFAYEFIAFVQLEFSLLTPDSEILPHYQRLQYNA